MQILIVSKEQFFPCGSSVWFLERRLSSGCGDTRDPLNLVLPLLSFCINFVHCLLSLIGDKILHRKLCTSMLYDSNTKPFCLKDSTVMRPLQILTRLRNVQFYSGQKVLILVFLECSIKIPGSALHREMTPFLKPVNYENLISACTKALINSSDDCLPGAIWYL